MEQLSLQFWNIILTSIAELDILKEVYLKNNRSIANKIGVAGTSMGGITTLGALTQHKWITAGVSLMGNPNYNQFARFLVTQIEKQGLILPFTTKQLENEYKKVQAFDLSLHADKLQGRPLLFWHGKKDPVVPYSYAYNFYQEVKNQYKDHPEDLQFILDEHAEHKVTREGVLKTVEWFEKHLT